MLASLLSCYQARYESSVNYMKPDSIPFHIINVQVSTKFRHHIF